MANSQRGEASEEREMTILRVALRGSWPGTLLVVTFEHAALPGCVFSWHSPVWTKETVYDPEPPYDEYLWVYLREYVNKYLDRHRDCEAGEVRDIGVLDPAVGKIVIEGEGRS